MKFKGKWLPESDKYKQACLRLADDLTDFKQDPDYIGYVGNDTRGAGVILAFDKVVNLPYVSENDKVGSPTLHEGKSAGTLRFMKVVQDTLEWDIKDIVEIGGGYGGQALVFNKLRPTKYTIIDIPEALKLAKAYLKDIKVKFISSENVPKIETDLLISDYCISELNNKGVDFYLDRIKAKYYYFTCNNMGESKDYLVNRLKEFCDITVVPEEPKTSHHDNYVIYAVANNNV